MTALPNNIRTPQQNRRQGFRNRGLCTQCGQERTRDGRALGPDCLAFLAAKRDACKPMKTADAEPHYLPLAAAPFRAFADGTKRTEYRRAGARFSLRNFPTGRVVILANGYAPKDHPTRTLRAVVTGFEVVAFDKLPRDIADSVLHYLDSDENPIWAHTPIACIGLEVTRTVSDYGHRDGPCVVEYRDFTWNGHPERRAHSCLGCKHLQVDSDYSSRHCAHPAHLKAYGWSQHIGGDYQHRAKYLCDSRTCPALRLRDEAREPVQPAANQINRGPEFRMREDDRKKIFAIPQL